ncbi:WD40/YVTN repeat-like-containing domain protein [Fusarium austroafricanum]|uniref:WD40/YVTN repeat-like-containing domain protein n=1 Tax=Fusarium austroafricanum TaxID=2364996 RepID=A0A8H4KQQ9_9HYPO|nr:WD40/YVTN repeat-like-containing domain protein [Fusarium austroafricanum]
MAACTYRNASLYAPVFPSPLNPASHGPENKHTTTSGRIVRRRRSRQGRRRPPGSHTLTQRFLRVKAADAWRGHVLSAQVAQYEHAEAAFLGIQGTKNRNCYPSMPGLKNLGLNLSLSDAHHIASRICLPDLSCLKTRRMLLAMGLVGLLPALKVRDMLRAAESL